MHSCPPKVVCHRLHGSENLHGARINFFSNTEQHLFVCLASLWVEFSCLRLAPWCLWLYFGITAQLPPKGAMPQATWFCKIAWGKAETFTTHCKTPTSNPCKFKGEMKLIKVGTLVLMVIFWLKCTITTQRWNATGYMVLKTSIRAMMKPFTHTNKHLIVCLASLWVDLR
jgi:hypothetical protein